MNLRVNKAHFPVTVLGYGRRIGIWVQGCSIGCRGCVSRDTWEADPATEMPVETLLAWCRDVSGGDLDGVTISGGEPFEQPEALAELLDGLDAWRRCLARRVDLLCYTGLPWRRVQRELGDLVRRLDVVIPEPFVRSRPTAPLRGSANQTIIPITDLGRERYGAIDANAERPRMQVRVDGERIWFIGIPGRGDMERLEATCRERGLILEGASWRA